MLLKGDAAAAERALNALPHDLADAPRVEAELGLLQFSKGDLAKARASFERALAKDRALFTALEALTVIDFRENKPAAARARIEAALAAQPRNDRVYLLAARTYVQVADYAAAERTLIQALSVNPNNLQAYGALGQFYAAQQRLPEATARFERLVQKQPNAVEALTTLGVLLQLQNRPAEARARYERVLELNPRAAVAANNLAWMHAEQGEQLDTALQLAQTAKAELPNVPEVSDTLGWLYYKKGLALPAITALRESVEKDPENATYHYHLGLAYARADRAAEARQSLQRALALKLPPAETAEANKAMAALRS
jgi:tetratricopeptide (TPR) repeat protein